MEIDHICDPTIGNIIRFYNGSSRDFIGLREFCLAAGAELNWTDIAQFVNASGLPTFGKSTHEARSINVQDSVFIALRPDDWVLFSELLDPFCDGLNSEIYQWIAGPMSDYINSQVGVNLLVSRSNLGTW